MTSILLVGCGRMGGALLEGWKQHLSGNNQFSVIDPSDQVSKHADTHWQDWDAIPSGYNPDVIMLAVKPQLMPGVLNQVKHRKWDNALFLTVAAGRTMAFYEEHLHPTMRLIRVMPNTPALIAKGMSGLCANAHVTDNDQTLATAMMEAVGEAVWLENESLMNAFTGLAGSGPAYIFGMIECMRDAGIAAGLNEDIAAKAALQTMWGAACLAKESDESPEALRHGVTSPGGTTQAGLDVLLRTQDGLPQLMHDVVKRAKERGEELA